MPFKDGEFDFVFETSLCHVAEKQVPRAIRELNRVMKTGLVFGSVTSDMAPALIDRYDLLRGRRRSSAPGGNGRSCSSPTGSTCRCTAATCTDELWAATLAGRQGTRPVVCGLRQPALLVLRQGCRRRFRRARRPRSFCRTHVRSHGIVDGGSPNASAAVLDFAVMPAVQHRLVSWRPSLHHRTIRIPLAADDPVAPELDEKLAADAVASESASATRPPSRPSPMTKMTSSR